MKTNDLDISLKEVFEEYLLYSQVEILKTADKMFGIKGVSYSFKIDGESFSNHKTNEEIKVFYAPESGVIAVLGWNRFFKTSGDVYEAVIDTIEFIREEFQKSGYKTSEIEEKNSFGFSMIFHGDFKRLEEQTAGAF